MSTTTERPSIEELNRSTDRLLLRIRTRLSDHGVSMATVGEWVGTTEDEAREKLFDGTYPVDWVIEFTSRLNLSIRDMLGD